MAKRKILTYYVSLPLGIDIAGYRNIDLTGRTQAVSKREAVSHLIARQFPKDRNKIALIMNELDVKYGGAENYAFSSQSEIPEVLQTNEDLEQGKKLTDYERTLLKEQALAYNLAVLAGADSFNSDIQMDYIDRARYLLREMNKIR